MKKFFKSILDLSLFQQLSVIIVTFAVIFVFFFTVYLRGNINDFVTNQVMYLIERSQNSVIENISNDVQGYYNITYDADIVHFIIKDNNIERILPKSVTYDIEHINHILLIANNHKEKVFEGDYTINGHYYYRLSTLENEIQVISIVGEKYAKSIEASLLNNVSNNSAVVFSIIFILLIVWVGTIITPLQLMKNYVEKIRKGKDAKLNINRNDEIGELAKALVDMRKEIKNQEELKEEMIHNISHDLKTPITTIKSYAQSIRDGIYPYDTLEGSVDVIIENADRLEKKVYSLLYLNRLDYMMDQEKETAAQTDMKKLIKNVVLSLKMIRPEVKVVCKLDNVIFKGETESWRVVVSNLMDNALRYADRQITIELKPYYLSVSNDGPSLSEDRIKKLFKPFEKGDKGKFGLGLSICYKICTIYNYTIVAENLDKGVVFKIESKDKPKPKHSISKLDIISKIKNNDE